MLSGFSFGGGPAVVRGPSPKALGRIWKTESGMHNEECGMQMRNAECKIRNAEYGMRNAECDKWSLDM